VAIFCNSFGFGALATLCGICALACSREPEPQRRLEATQQASPPSATVGFLPTRITTAAAPTAAQSGMVWVPGAEFSMGSADPTLGGHCHEPMDDARPIHRVEVSGFFMDQTEVQIQTVRNSSCTSAPASRLGASGEFLHDKPRSFRALARASASQFQPR
jgi:hypothetical protein